MIVIFYRSPERPLETDYLVAGSSRAPLKFRYRRTRREVYENFEHLNRDDERLRNIRTFRTRFDGKTLRGKGCYEVRMKMDKYSDS